ncbi:uncharacterized protein LOC122753527 [Dromiciops gliroides]|uniref:uncharacterized protein LOC122753527 n=1 Tax=Dromiciops gliroides TaxID=33562 RepID=UPI001CC68CF5|nr:uncharacterized protein LOC122753527 [Dromiciops gliroides]
MADSCFSGPCVPTASAASVCSSDVSCGSNVCLPSSGMGSSWQLDDCPESCCEPGCCGPSCCPAPCCTPASCLTLVCRPVCCVPATCQPVCAPCPCQSVCTSSCCQPIACGTSSCQQSCCQPSCCIALPVCCKPSCCVTTACAPASSCCQSSCCRPASCVSLLCRPVCRPATCCVPLSCKPSCCTTTSSSSCCCAPSCCPATGCCRPSSCVSLLCQPTCCKPACCTATSGQKSCSECAGMALSMGPPANKLHQLTILASHLPFFFILGLWREGEHNLHRTACQAQEATADSAGRSRETTWAGLRTRDPNFLRVERTLAGKAPLGNMPTSANVLASPRPLSLHQGSRVGEKLVVSPKRQGHEKARVVLSSTITFHKLIDFRDHEWDIRAQGPDRAHHPLGQSLEICLSENFKEMRLREQVLMVEEAPSWETCWFGVPGVIENHIVGSSTVEAALGCSESTDLITSLDDPISTVKQNITYNSPQAAGKAQNAPPPSSLPAPAIQSSDLVQEAFGITLSIPVRLKPLPASGTQPLPDAPLPLFTAQGTSTASPTMADSCFSGPCVPTASAASVCSSDVSCGSNVCLPSSGMGSSWQLDDCPENCCEPGCCGPSCCPAPCCTPASCLVCRPVCCVPATCQPCAPSPCQSFCISSCSPACCQQSCCQPIACGASSCQQSCCQPTCCIALPVCCKPSCCVTTACAPASSCCQPSCCRPASCVSLLCRPVCRPATCCVPLSCKPSCCTTTSSSSCCCAPSCCPATSCCRPSSCVSLLCQPTCCKPACCTATSGQKSCC